MGDRRVYPIIEPPSDTHCDECCTKGTVARVNITWGNGAPSICRTCLRRLRDEATAFLRTLPREKGVDRG